MSVRLACVRHAASVHPEPGSNSHVIFLQLFKFSCQSLLASSFVSGLLFLVEFSQTLISRFRISFFSEIPTPSASLLLLGLLQFVSSLLPFPFISFPLRLSQAGLPCLFRGIFRVALLFICQGAVAYLLNMPLRFITPPTEKEGFEPSRRY